MTGHFEGKKHAYRQTQDGVVVSFVIHPNDLDAGFAVAPLGTRYMVGFAEICDDGKPVAPAVVKAPEAPKERKPFNSLPMSQQAALRCQDKTFQEYTQSENADDAAKAVRIFCQVDSRSELDNPLADIPRAEWRVMESGFKSWLTTRQYAESLR